MKNPSWLPTPTYYWVLRGNDYVRVGYTDVGNDTLSGWHGDWTVPTDWLAHATPVLRGEHSYLKLDQPAIEGGDKGTYPLVRTGNTVSPGMPGSVEPSTGRGSASRTPQHGDMVKGGKVVGHLNQTAALGAVHRTSNGQQYQLAADGVWYYGVATGVPAPSVRQYPQPVATASAQPVSQPSRAGRPSAPRRQGSGYTVAGNPPHAYKGSVDLGLLVNDHQTVKPTNGGRLWALYNLTPDGSLSFVDRYGSVPGAPPPPNAAQNQVPHQFYPPPAPQAPVYAQPQYAPTYAQPQYAPAPVYAPQPVYTSTYAQPQYAPAPVYAPQDVMVAQPMFAPPQYAPQPVYAQPQPMYVPQPVYAQPQSQPQYGAQYGVDPVTGMPLTAEQAAWYAQYGTQAVADQIAQSQQQPQQGYDPLTMSILMGGGGNLGGLGGMSGGLDAGMLGLLSGGDADLALQLALDNGGYDPTAGGMVEPY